MRKSSARIRAKSIAACRSVRRLRPRTTRSRTASSRRIPRPHERYSAARFVLDARRAIDDITARGRRAIVAGGTGFYLRALAGDVTLDAAYDPAVVRGSRPKPVSIRLRCWRVARRARARACGGDCAERSISRRARARSRTRRRFRMPTRSVADIARRRDPFVKLVLESDPDILLERIERRVDGMLAAGLLEEAERVGGDAVAADAVGYRERLPSGRCRRGGATAQLIRFTRRYAKRQQRGFVRNPAPCAYRRLPLKRRQERLGWE